MEEMVMRKLLLITIVASTVACGDEPATIAANVPSSHPLSGYWKDGHCDDDFGLLIAPAGDRVYSISFCGPGGCFEPGTYRRNSPIVGDPDYRPAGEGQLYVSLSDGSFQRYIRCPHHA